MQHTRRSSILHSIIEIVCGDHQATQRSAIVVSIWILSTRYSHRPECYVDVVIIRAVRFTFLEYT